MKATSFKSSFCEIEKIDRITQFSAFKVQLKSGRCVRRLYLSADVLCSPSKFARELLRELGWVPLPCAHTRHGGWPLGRWYSLIASRMTDPTKRKRDGRANVRPAKNRSH